MLCYDLLCALCLSQSVMSLLCLVCYVHLKYTLNIPVNTLYLVCYVHLKYMLSIPGHIEIWGGVFEIKVKVLKILRKIVARKNVARGSLPAQDSYFP